MLRVNLSQFLAMSPAEQAKVTHLDLFFDEEAKPYRNSDLRDIEEYPGEAKDWGDQS